MGRSCVGQDPDWVGQQLESDDPRVPAQQSKLSSWCSDPNTCIIQFIHLCMLGPSRPASISAEVMCFWHWSHCTWCEVVKHTCSWQHCVVFKVDSVRPCIVRPCTSAWDGTCMYKCVHTHTHTRMHMQFTCTRMHTHNVYIIIRIYIRIDLHTFMYDRNTHYYIPFL